MAQEQVSRTDTNLDGAPNGGQGISLIDHTRTTDDPPNDPDFSRTTSRLSKSHTQGSIRQTLARRKYQRSKWQEGRGSSSAIRVLPELADVGESSEPQEAAASGKASSNKSDNREESESDTWGKGRVRRGGRKVKDVLRTPKQREAKQARDATSHVDVLYENQRGFFFLGIPRFSSNSLLQIDPAAWLDSRFRPSAVDITNAQVPDPSWEWAWRCWYVDMSGDVDEEGWEYSFMFGKSSWHGTHPWFHSFVRRRRWLRKRTKRKGTRAKEEGHALTSDYFTIHSNIRPGEDDNASQGANEKRGQYSLATSSAWGPRDLDGSSDTAEIASIPDLLKALRTAAIDREKILVVRKFLNDGGEELHYLAENMEHIMKLLVFQNSRRQLLSILMHEFEAAEQHRKKHEDRDEPEDEGEENHLNNLLRAVEAADDQCKQLEYWSDVRDMARDGEILAAADHKHGWDHGWEGLDASGPQKQGGSPTDSQSEIDADSEVDKTQSKGKMPANSDAHAPIFSDGSGDQDGPRQSIDSDRRDIYYSPVEEKTQAQAMHFDISLPKDTQTPSQESEFSIDTFQSANSEPDVLSEDDDQATEKAPSEDERDVEDTPIASPPPGRTPVEAVTKVLDTSHERKQSTGWRGQSDDVD